ncbi:M3 family metallopeptidase [Pseudomonas putida]|uniref:M3 family metallopeptidase n=1 Tax=Pseudomonas putida TaxID=303 RepID=UPI0023652D0F|nr:M3 family metallopeptidase [Pseudomonas putida]MDD2049880.1 M3 family metallopeptidase [Pseudomonas putida]
MSTKNPLLALKGLIAYDKVTVEHVRPAIDQVIAAHEDGIERIIERQQALPTWDDLVLAVDELDAGLQGVFYSMVPLMTWGDNWAAAVLECYALIDARFKRKVKNARLYALYERLANSAVGRNLDAHQRSTLQQTLKAFRLAGVGLDNAGQLQLEQLEARIRELEARFRENLGKSVEQSSIHITDNQRLDGVPEPLRAEMANKAREVSLSGWLIVCEQAACTAILEHATDRTLREQVYRAYNTRGWDSDAAFDNGPVLEQLAQERHNKARLLGFDNYLELSLQSKSAGCAEQVLGFLDGLVRRVSPAMGKWQERQRETARARGLTDVEPWDVAYLQASIKQTATGLSKEALRDFFPLDKVVDALRELAQQLFGVTLNRYDSVTAWDSSVQTFEVLQDHAVIGYLYLDLIDRPGKQALGVSTSYLWNRRIDAEGIYHGAVATVFTDISPGLGDAQPLLDHLSLRKLFHEYGHALHHLLVRTGNHLLSDVRQLGTDGVEVSGKLLERWAWHADYLASISSHHEHGQALTAAQVQEVLVQLQGEGIEECARNLSQALFDLDLHRAGNDGRTIEQRAATSHAQVSGWPLAGFERPMHAFDHLVSGYEAGYYAYLWSDALACDLFSRFESEGLLNARTGRALQEAFLSQGAARPLVENLSAFLGRPVSHEPYLRWLGLAEDE